MRDEMMDCAHKSHGGIGACLRRIRECIFWPALSKNTKWRISTCVICLSHADSQMKEPIIQPGIGETILVNDRRGSLWTAWQNVFGSDWLLFIFHIDRKVNRWIEDDRRQEAMQMSCITISSIASVGTSMCGFGVGNGCRNHMIPYTTRAMTQLTKKVTRVVLHNDHYSGWQNKSRFCVSLL